MPIDDDIRFNPFNYKALTFLEFLNQIAQNPLFAGKPQWLKVLLAGRLDIIASYIDARANDAMFHSMYTKQNVFNFAGYLNYNPDTAQCATGTIRVTIKPTVVLPITIPKAQLIFQTPFSVGGQPVLFSALTDITFTAYIQDIAVKEGKQYSDEQAYVLTGAKFEEFNVLRPGLVKGTVSVIIDGQVWSEVDSLIDSQPLDKHFRVLYYYDKTMRIRGGDGEYGSLFPIGFSPTVQAWYGGGTRGNVLIDKVTSYIGGNTDILSCTNLAAMTGGSGEESIDKIKIYAPLHVQAQNRAVSKDDFRVLSETFSGVERVFIEPNYYGVLSVRVQVIPTGGGNPSSTLRDNLTLFLKLKTLLSNIFISVENPKYHPIDVAIELAVAEGYDYATVAAYVQLAGMLVVSELAQEFKEAAKSQGISAAIEYIDTKWGFTFDKDDSVVQNQINRILNEVEILEWEEDVYVNKFYSAADVIDGVDYIIVLSPPAIEVVPTEYIASLDSIVVTPADMPERTVIEEVRVTTVAIVGLVCNTVMTSTVGISDSCDSEVV